MTWAPSKALQDALIDRYDVEDEPELYPPELVAALKRIDELETIGDGSSQYDPEFMFSVEGYIVDDGLVGVHPNASDRVKEEWMKIWRSRKANPNALT